MNLYTNGLTYAGTQADARKLWGKDYKSIEIPTDKSGLINYLNNTFSAPVPTAHTMTQPEPQPTSRSTVQAFKSPWGNIKEVAEQATFSELGAALAVVMDRLQDAAELEKKV